jgi:hypothetical protein
MHFEVYQLASAENTFKQGILTEGGRLSTVDLIIKVACFVKRKLKFSK